MGTKRTIDTGRTDALGRRVKTSGGPAQPAAASSSSLDAAIAADRGCSFPGCDQPHEAKGLCTGHYRQQRLGKDLVPLRRQNKAGCSFPGCAEPHKAKGLCPGHYQQQRRGLELTDLEPRTGGCRFEGCDRPVEGDGLCDGHYRQQRRGADLHPLNEERVCSFPDCGRPHKAKGLCVGHYDQVRRGVPSTPLGTTKPGPKKGSKRAPRPAGP